jgi:Domain of unknown function DUF1828
MTVQTIEEAFKHKVCESVFLLPEGVNRYRVFVPFLFDDGDHLVIVLKKELGRWILSDEGHTFMRLTYDMEERDFQRGTRHVIITNALTAFAVQDRDGELVLPIEDEQYGDALYSFVQALLKITDVTYLTRERVRSTFLEDFRAFLITHVPEERRMFDWHDPQRDPEGIYTVDCRVNSMPRPLYVYALSNDDRVRDATIGILHFEQLRLSFRAVGIFEDQAEINRRVLARFTDVCERQFSSLSANRDRIAAYIGEAIRGVETPHV